MLPKLHTLAFEYDEHGGAPPADEPDAGADAGDEGGEPSSSFDFAAIREHPEFQDALSVAAREEIQSLVEQAGAQTDEYGDPLEDVDAYDDPDDFRENLRGWVRQEIQQAIGPMMPTVEAMQSKQNEEQIGAMLDKIPEAKQAAELLPEDAGVDARRLVEYAANGYLPDIEANMGASGPRAVDRALRMAANELHTALKAAHAAGYAARNAELGRLSGAPTPTASLKPSEATPIQEQAPDEMAAIEAYLGRNGRL